MAITFLDGIIIVTILLSSFLAMVRGFSREILSLTSWIIAAIITFFSFRFLLPFVEPYISNKMIALITTLVVVFVVMFSIISIITMKIADSVIGSRVCMLDRILGFIFGMFRGMFIMVISVMLINTLVKPEQQAGWLKNAKAKPILDSLSKKVWETLSPNTDYILEKIDNILEKDMHKNMPTQNEDMPLQNNEGYSTE